MTALPPMSRLTDELTAFSCDVTALLPVGWDSEIRACSAEHSSWQVLEGGSVTSREDLFVDPAPPKVGVVAGDVVARELPWLDSCYRNEFLAIVNSLADEDYEVSTDLRAGVNINATPRGARYEWHVDSNPMTGLLFVTSHPEHEGGQLLFRPDPSTRPDEDWSLRISPSAGTLLVFDAREAAHVVTTLNAELRLSVPMNYYFLGRQERPGDLDGYLYR